MSNHRRTVESALSREAADKQNGQRLPSVEPSGIHFSELPAATPTDVFFLEWNTYRQEIAHWIAEGQQGRYVLIKGEAIIGIYDTWDEARKTGLQRYLLEPFFVHCIHIAEPILRVRGINFPCPS